MPSDATLWGVGWGGGCLILDTDTESYVTSLPVCVCVCVCVCVNVSAVSIVDDSRDQAIEILFFISSRCLQILA